MPLGARRPLRSIRFRWLLCVLVAGYLYVVLVERLLRDSDAGSAIGGSSSSVGTAASVAELISKALSEIPKVLHIQSTDLPQSPHPPTASMPVETQHTALAAGQKPVVTVGSTVLNATPQSTMLNLTNLECVEWRQTQLCNPFGPLERHGQRTCQQPIQPHWSGFCVCHHVGDGVNINVARSDCDHRLFTCEEACAVGTLFASRKLVTKLPENEEGQLDSEELPEGAGCVAFRRTQRCDPHGIREPVNDLPCSERLPVGASGHCECTDRTLPVLVECNETATLQQRSTCSTLCMVAARKLLRPLTPALKVEARQTQPINHSSGSNAGSGLFHNRDDPNIPERTLKFDHSMMEAPEDDVQ